jgi:hypothetical protein
MNCEPALPAIDGNVLARCLGGCLKQFTTCEGWHHQARAGVYSLKRESCWTINKLIGHRNIATTALYWEVSDARL